MVALGIIYLIAGVLLTLADGVAVVMAYQLWRRGCRTWILWAATAVVATTVLVVLAV